MFTFYEFCKKTCKNGLVFGDFTSEKPDASSFNDRMDEKISEEIKTWFFIFRYEIQIEFKVIYTALFRNASADNNVPIFTFIHSKVI